MGLRVREHESLPGVEGTGTQGGGGSPYLLKRVLEQGFPGDGDFYVLRHRQLLEKRENGRNN